MGYGKAGKGGLAGIMGKAAGPYGKATNPAAVAAAAGGGGKGKGDPACKLYVGSLSYKTTWRELKDHFAQAGTVAYANVLVMWEVKGKGCANRDGWSKGTGIIEMSTPAEAQMAVATLNDSVLDGRQILVKAWDASGASKSKGSAPGADFAKGTALKAALGLPAKGAVVWKGAWGGKGKGKSTADMKKANPDAKIWVGSLSFKTTWERLKEHMGQAGTVVYAKINTDAAKGGISCASGQGWSKGTGLVEYASAVEAQNAVAILNESELDGRKILVDLWGNAGGKGKGGK